VRGGRSGESAEGKTVKNLTLSEQADPANEERKSAIVTIRQKRSTKFGPVPDMTEEEHRRRGDAATALWRELMRRIAD